MKHASAGTWLRLQPLLADLRGVVGLQERKPGIFYRRGAAFWHFHEDPGGLFADLKADVIAFTRLPVDTPAPWANLLAAVRSSIG